MAYDSGNPYPGNSFGPHMDEKSMGRLRMVARIAVIWALLIVLRLLQLQIIRHDDYMRLAQSQQQTVKTVHALRGGIYDRHGRALAMSVEAKSICVNPMLVRDIPVTADLLASVLQLDAKELRERMESALERGSGFLWVKRKVAPEEYTRVEALKLVGVEFRDETKRVYPKGPLAAHVIGSVDHEEKGNAGIELGLNEELEGIDGQVRLMRDVKARGYDSLLEERPVPGKQIRLTIDERIQFVAEESLARAAKGCRCSSGSVVVMDPRSGDILAMASYPTFDPNEPVEEEKDLKARLNLAVSAPFEPGSVFKVITLATALETTPMGPDTVINCLGGRISLYGRVIHEAKGGFGAIPMRTVLAKSSNVGAIQIAMRVGERNMHAYMKKFGFGQRTGIPLPAESPGMVHELRNWGKTSIGSVAMGHEVMATTLQLSRAAAVVANGGYLVQPRIVLEKQRPGEAPERAPVDPPVRILRPENAQKMRWMMEEVVLQGTGKGARVAGYSTGGKTGSAQIFDPELRQYTHRYNASFLGMAPMRRPVLVAVVSLHGGTQYGGTVAAPVFKEVMTAALRILDVPKDEEEVLAQKQAKPDDAVEDLAAAPEEVDAATAEAFALASGTEVVVRPAQALRQAEGEVVRAPDLRGKSLRDVLDQVASVGLHVEPKGMGIARNQYPAAGTLMSPGDRIQVQFGQ